MDKKLVEQTLDAILEMVDVGIHVVDNTGVTILYNKAAAKLEGMELDQVIGYHILAVYPSLDGETSTLLKVCSTLKPILNQQQSFTNYKGNRITTINSTVPIISEGRLIGAVEISKDITEVRELSERLVDLQARIFERPNRKGEAPLAKYRFEDLIGQAPSFLDLKRTALRAANSNSSVLVHGETGTGKELLVQSMHNASARANRPFVAQNCAALPETLLESILFGTAKGSFTGAENRPGLFEVADGGTLFLDEINAMPLAIQAKLLRALQEQQVRRVGDTRMRPVDVRIMVAMNVDPWQAVRSGQLREDLYFRVNVVQLQLPPLRHRLEDLPLLVQHFLEKYNQKFSKRVLGLSDQVKQLFHTYPWPGNVRELEHAIEGALNIADSDIIDMRHIPAHIREGLLYKGASNGLSLESLDPDKSLKEALAELEILMIEKALERTGGNISQAAMQLGIPRQTLQYRMKALRI